MQRQLTGRVVRVRAPRPEGTKACPGCGTPISGNKATCLACSKPTCCGRHALEGHKGQPCGGLMMPPENILIKSAGEIVRPEDAE